MSSEAEEFKNTGNKLYAEKKYVAACECYEKAVALAPDNYLIYNNIAAVKLALKKYDEAIDVAKKALAIKNNFKSHSRIGTALLAQQKYREAKVELLIALSMEPNNETVKGQLAAIDAKEQEAQAGLHARFRLPPPIGGEFLPVSTGVVGVVLSLMIVLLSVASVVGIFLRMALASVFWKVQLLLTMAQQLLIMHKRGLVQFQGFQLSSLKQWSRYHPTMLFLLCLGLFLFAPHYLIAVFIGIYSALDVASQKAEVLTLAGPMAPVLAPRLQRLADIQVEMRLAAASFEVFTLVTCIFPNGNYVLPLVYVQYIRYRYQRDVFVQLGFTSLKQNIEKVTRCSYAPPSVDRLFQKLCGYLSKYAKA